MRLYLSIITVILMPAAVTAVDWDAFDFSAKYDEPPIPVITVKALLPEGYDAFNGLEVYLAILVDTEGKVSDAVLLDEDVKPEVEEAVMEAVVQNRYEPAKYKGKPVEIWYTVSVTVEAEGSDSSTIEPPPNCLIIKGPEKHDSGH